MCRKLFLVSIVLVVGLASTVFAVGDPVSPRAFTNRKAGIDVSLSGTNGTDWAVEHTYHDTAIADQLIYLKSNVNISLAHNERNSIMKRSDTVLPAVIGIDGYDGVPDSGDEGDIHYKIDRDMQSHRYSSSGTIPSYAPIYSAPFKFDTLTYDGVLDVLGLIGDNGADWGSTPRGSTERFGYGQNDAAGNEWHTLTYWDDDEPVYQSVGESSHRQGASDGHWVYMCVNPSTPVIQFKVSGDEQYYTTPLKTYHVPKTWEQTTYLTSGVQIAFINITNSDPIYWRVDGSSWQEFGSNNLVASEIFTTVDAPSLLEVKAGTGGVVLERNVVMSPGFPAPTETHGYLLWADDIERQAIIDKVGAVQPFKKSYETFLGDYYQKANQTFEDTRDGWRAGASQASLSLSNGFAVAIDGPSTRAANAAACKTRLLRAARLEAVGFEDGVSNATPSKDYLNELGQTIQQFADAGVAYDMLAAHYRNTQDPNGMTPIEEIRIRDGLAEIAKTILQVRANWSYISGSGDTHWAHGYELAFGIIAAAMPTYKTPYFGVSGGDMTTINDLIDGNGKYWNPFPDQGVAWYECATDSEIDTPGHPNVRAPLRSEFQMSDDGYWMGPNNLVGDGDRYVTGPSGNRLVDVKYGGLANAECRIELVEMAGYESPFVSRIHVLDFMRRLEGDTNQLCVTNYIRRRLMAGYIPLSWDSGSKTYSKQDPRAIGSIYAFNNHYEAAPLQSSVDMITQLLTYINRYYGYESGGYPAYTDSDRKAFYGAYALALCVDPNALDPHAPEANHRPIIKPTYKHVVKPNEDIYKQIIAMDPDDDSLTVSVSNLPGGASYNSSTRTITWTPGSGDTGVYIVTITADDGTTSKSRPFPIIVKSDAGSGPIPSGPTNVTATLQAGNEVYLNWDAPGGVDVANYVIYRDGSLHDVVAGTQTDYTDTDALPEPSHTRYHLALYDTNGGESSAAAAVPAIISVAVGGNQPPIADAGPDQTVTDTDENGSEIVTLDGSGSYDPDGTITSYVWKEGVTQIATGVTPDVMLDVGEHTITLEVTDNNDATDTDIVVVTVNSPGNQVPVADAGSDQEVTDTDENGSEVITLDGSGSYDPDGTIESYVWKEGVTQIATGVSPDVTLDVGVHTITLEVTDNGGLTDTDTVVITVNAGGANQPPVADAGSDQTVTDSDSNGSEDVTLDGSGSYDPDGTIDSYVWEENGSQIATGVSPNVTLSVGVHIITLEVTDNDAATDTDMMAVIVGSASAHNWNGAGDGSSWNDPDNWVEDAVPATTADGEGADDVLIDGSCSVHVTADVISIHGLIVGGNAELTIDPDITLAVQSLDVVNGGLVVDGTGALLKWGKANRGRLSVESDGYIAGTGTVQTAASTSQGVFLKSTRSADFDMTSITLKMAYQEDFWVCSPDLGRESSSYWSADNFTIGKVYLTDGRFNYPLHQADGSIGGGTNALYCMELQFAEKLGEGAHMDLQGINLYVRDKITWFDGSTAETPGQLTVATAYDPLDVTSSVYDNDVPQGEAWIGYSTTGPSQATNPNPADSATGVSVDADLSWTAGAGATSHDVYFGTTSPGTFQGNQTATTFDPGTMADDTTYYWRIDEVNGGTTTGVVWSFTTETASDTTPPSPDPMTWATVPYATGASSISMTATIATDVSGVEYYFDETSGNPGGTDSGWQDSTTYEDTGLNELTQYTYQVKARDKSANLNETAYSTAESATTQDGTAPTPDPMTWTTVPYATGASSISMTATTATDASGVEYYFDETSGNPGGTDSGWQDSATYEDTGLNELTQYTYQVKARDKSANLNETAYSTSQSATTQDDTAPSPDPMTWATVPYATGTSSISMTATTATDSSGVEYYFDCTAGGGNDSGWQDSATYEDTGLSPETQYTYQVKARDKSANQNETAYSTVESATTGVELEPGLVSWWKLDESSGTTAADSSGNGHDGTLVGGSWAPTSGKIDGAVSLGDVNDNRVQVPTTLMSASAGTVSLWGRLEGTQTADMRYFFGHTSGSTPIDWADRIQLFMSAGDNMLDLGLGDTHTKHPDIVTLSVDTWYHIALTWDGTNYVVYVDGIEKASGTYTGLATLNTIADIGNDGCLGFRVEAFQGLLDEVLIYDAALSKYDIADLAGITIASSPSPADSATGVDADADLSWSAGYYADTHDVYLGTDYNSVLDANQSSSEFQGNQSSTTYDPGTMDADTTYYWAIDEVNDTNTWPGDVWSFTTAGVAAPGQASNPSPADGATDVSIDADLSWTAGSGADSHDVYFGTTSPGDFQGNQTAATFDPGVMTNDTTYYCRIDEVNAGGTTTGVVWSFTTIVAAPGQASNPSPADGATDVSIDADLSWTAGSGADSHDVYFGTTSPGDFQGNQTGTTFDPGAMANDTTYYCRIDEVNAGGTTTGVVWSFTTEAIAPPGQASNPSPADGAADVNVDADLSWTAGSGADSHDVYFGTTSPGDFQGNQTGTTFDPGAMANDTTYYWRIDEVNAGGTTTGVVWSFTTEVAAALEIYVNDIAMSYKVAGPNRNGIAAVWIKDTSGADVEGATVYGDWSGLVSESDSGVTGTDGKVTLSSSKIKSGGTFTFTVTDVVKSGSTYNSSLNVETSDSVTAP